MKRLFIFFITAMFILSSVSYANSEDYTKYTTEYLLEMKAAIEAELERRNVNAEVITDQEPVYQDEYVTVCVDSITLHDKTVIARFLVECSEGHSCLIAPNFNEDLLTSVDAFTLLRTINQIGAGNTDYICALGKSLLCEFEWDIDEIYNYSFFYFNIYELFS